MSSSKISVIESLSPENREYLEALLAAPRPGAEKILAFHDQRIGRICKDPRLLFAPLDDHIFHRGDGLFESICFRDNVIFALDAHIDRLMAGAMALSLTPPCPFPEIRRLIIEVAKSSGESHGDLRLFLSRGPGGFGISPRECPIAGLYIVALKSALPDPGLYEKGLAAFTSAYPPKQEYLARIKNTNYLANVFMAAEALEKGMDVAITFDERGHMGEAAIANVGIVDRDGTLRCPSPERILGGTTLLAALKLARERMPVLEGPVHASEIKDAKEMLLFTSATLCVPITHFDGMPIGEGEQAGEPGPTAHWLRDALYEYMLSTGVRIK